MKCFLQKQVLWLFICLAPVLHAGAQGLLQRTITLTISGRPLPEVLKAVEKQAGFYFSYNSKVISRNKLVSLSVKQQTVKAALDLLFDGDFVYKEMHNHVILQPSGEKWYTLSGYVLDANTGLALTDASVYERQQLVAALTNSEGFFKLRLKEKYPVANITISKEWYLDTSIVFNAGSDEVYRLPVSPIRNVQMNDVVVTQNNRVPDSWLARLFLSSNLKAQARNISGYLASRPIQASFIPGLSTQGRLSGQIINRFSLNILGGYTAGAKGAEVGGIFNISKKDMNGVQIGGVFNVVGGKTNGVQVAGVYNDVLDSVDGVQVSGVINKISANANGVIVAGVYNRAEKNVNGLQVAGVANTVGTRIDGTQIAGVVNYVRGQMDGLQVSGGFNYAKTVHGMQIGVVNIADSSDGYSLGLINYSRNGYHKAVVSFNDVTQLNFSIKTGNAKLYTILTGGMSLDPDNKAYAFGVGLGKDFILDKHWLISTEFTMQHVYLGSWDHSHFVYRFAPSIQCQINKFLAIFAGNSLSVFESPAIKPVEGYKSTVAPENPLFKTGKNMSGWFGVQAGVIIF